MGEDILEHLLSVTDPITATALFGVLVIVWRLRSFHLTTPSGWSLKTLFSGDKRGKSDDKQMHRFGSGLVTTGVPLRLLNDRESRWSDDIREIFCRIQASIALLDLPEEESEALA